MSLLYVTEYSGVAYAQIGADYMAVPLEPPLADYTVAFGANSPAFQSRTILVRVHADAICSVLFGKAPTATTTNARMGANQTEYHGVPQSGLQVSVVSNT